MKAFGMIAAAGLMAATLGVGTSTAADAQPRHGRDGWHERHDGGRHWRGDRWRGGYGWRGDRGWGRHYGWRGDYGWRRHYGWRGYRRCWTEWRFDYPVRICR